jgi:repressor LexA
MSNLTKKQKQVFDFINTYITENGISPTIEEIRKKLKLKAVSTIHEHINSLKEKGYLSKSENSVRGLTIKKRIKKVVRIPIVGTLVAWQPKSKDHEIDSKKFFALRVKGDAMSEEGIFDGDLVIVKNYVGKKVTNQSLCSQKGSKNL